MIDRIVIFLVKGIPLKKNTNDFPASFGANGCFQWAEKEEHMVGTWGWGAKYSYVITVGGRVGKGGEGRGW